MMLEDTPPGQQPTRISPTVSPGERRSACAIDQASRGITVNCARAPTAIASGLRARMAKSRPESVRPIESMMTPRIAVWTSPFIQSNATGRQRAAAAASVTKSGAKRASRALAAARARKVARRSLRRGGEGTDAEGVALMAPPF